MTERRWPTYHGHPIVLLPPALYDAAEREGYDMGRYRKIEPIPTDALGEQASADGEAK
jgi:hypothetical protein